MERLNTRIDYADDFGALCASIGLEIEEIWRDQYYFNDDASEDDGSLAFRFAGGKYLTLSLAADGDSVRASSEEHELQPGFWISDENYCSWQKVALTDEPQWMRAKAAAVEKVEALVWEWTSLNGCPEAIVEWRLMLSSGDCISYLNKGDDSVILFNESFPVAEVEDVRARWIRVCQSKHAV